MFARVLAEIFFNTLELIEHGVKVMGRAIARRVRGDAK